MRLLYRIPLGLFCLWLMVGNGLADRGADPTLPATPSISLFAHTQHVAIDGRLEYLIEPRPLSAVQAAGPAFADQWVESSVKGLNFGSLHPPVWLRFNLINQTDRERSWWLEIGSPLLDHVSVSLYRHDCGTWHFNPPTGQLLPTETRAVQHRHFIQPLTLAPREENTVYVRVASNAVLLVYMDLWQQNAFLLNEQFQILLLGLFFGALAAMFLYNWSLYFFTRDRAYLFYVFYVFFIVLYALAETGLGNQYLWNQVDWLKGIAYPLFASASFLAAALFIRVFLALKSEGGWVYHFNTFFVAYWGYATIAFLFFPHRLLIISALPMAAVGSLVAMATGIYLWAKGNTSAKYFIIAWTFLNVGTLLHVLMLNRTIPRTPFTQYIQMVGMVMEVVLLSVALAERINRTRKQQRLAQDEVLQLTEKISKAREEKLMIQEQLLEVQRQANEALEVRVLDRTNELERALTNLEAANKELSRMSFADPMTKLYNRRYFDQILTSEIQRASRTQHPLSIILADIDGFKQVSDQHGHLIGDECLRMVAKTLSRQLGRSSDLIARFSGEAFGILLPATAPQNALVVADRARTAVEQINFIHRGRRIPLSVSLGVAGWIPTPRETPDLMVAAAEHALLEAKQGGHNRVASADAR